MIIFLHGPDDYRRREKKKAIVAEFRKKHGGLGLESFDLARENDAVRFADFSRSQSLFEPEKFAVLENLYEEGEKDFAPVLKEAAKVKYLTVLISEREKTNANFPFLAGKSAAVKAQKFEHLKGKEWEAFVLKQAAARELTLNPAVLRFLARAYEGDSWRLVTEFEKLALLGSAVSEKDLGSFGIEIAPDFWGTVNGIKDFELNVRLASLEKLLARNEPVQKIFNMLLYGWPDKLARLAQYDVAIKSGKLDYEEVLVDLVI